MQCCWMCAVAFGRATLFDVPLINQVTTGRGLKSFRWVSESGMQNKSSVNLRRVRVCVRAEEK